MITSEPGGTRAACSASISEKVPFAQGTACSAPTKRANSAPNARASVLGLGKPPQLPLSSTRSERRALGLAVLGPGRPRPRAQLRAAVQRELSPPDAS